MSLSRCDDCGILHAPDFHKSKTRKPKTGFRVDDEVYVLRSLRHIGLDIYAGDKGKVILAPKGGRVFVQFHKVSGWIDQDNLSKSPTT
jgi:hypothetical protein